jgi:hypothetical protein
MNVFLAKGRQTAATMAATMATMMAAMMAATMTATMTAVATDESTVSHIRTCRHGGWRRPVVIFFTIHTFSTCICGAVLSTTPLFGSLSVPFGPLQTAAHTLVEWLACRPLVVVFLTLRRLHLPSCTGAEARVAPPGHVRPHGCCLFLRLERHLCWAAATCVSRVAGAPSLDIDRLDCSRRDGVVLFACSRELKENRARRPGTNGQLSDMAVWRYGGMVVCSCLTAQQCHESTASRLNLSIREVQYDAHALALRLHTGKDSCNPFDRGSRLRILCCEPGVRCIQVSALV